MTFKTFIPTCGLGSRLGAETLNRNKSLVTIGSENAISKLIKTIPADSELVIALGYRGNEVRDFVQHAFQDRNITYRSVDLYEGQGSGLGYTLLCCKDLLLEPFIFISCDTLVETLVQPPDSNWIGLADKKPSPSYRTVRIDNGLVKDIFEKNTNVQSHGAKPYIGLAGIKDYKIFWQSLENGGAKAIHEGEVYGLRALAHAKSVTGVVYDWHDTGSIDELVKCRNRFEKECSFNILPKSSESIWFVNGKVIKYSDDLNFISGRVARSNILEGFVPMVKMVGDHMYSYDFIEGDVVSRTMDPDVFLELLAWLEEFWSPMNLPQPEKEIFVQLCYDFYKTKTEIRLNQFYERNNVSDKPIWINGIQVNSLQELMDGINWLELADGVASRIHGDLHFENIIRGNDGRYTLIDWRQDFGGCLEYGDLYYDLAKLLHGMIVSHAVIHNHGYSVNASGNDIILSIGEEDTSKICRELFKEWCLRNGLVYERVEIITALIFLNISALHHAPYSIFLYYLGHSMLNKSARAC